MVVLVISRSSLICVKTACLLDFPAMIKQVLRKLFWPILNIFESGNAPFVYKVSHRVILIVMGSLFSGLASSVLLLSWGDDMGYLLPVAIFGGAGFLCLLLGFIGNDRAVAKIWGSH